MPDREFAETLHSEADAWVADDIVNEEQADALRARYAPLLTGERRDDEAGWSTGVLHGAAAVLLGAAAIAFVLIGLDPPQSTWHLAVAGAALSGTGLLLLLTQPQRERLADAVLASGMAPLAAATFPDPLHVGVALLALGLPAALLALRRSHGFVPALSVVAFTVAAGGSSLTLLDGNASFIMWFGLQVALVAATVVLDRVLDAEDRTLPAALATAGLAVSFVPYAHEALALGGSEEVEIALGALMLVVGGIAYAIRHRGLLVGAAIALSVDAIVFAFDFGQVWGGTLTLLALAALLLWQGERVRDALTDPSEFL